MTDKKPKTVDEIAIQFTLDAVNLYKDDPSGLERAFKQALLQFAAQESAPLVEALEHIERQDGACSPCQGREGITITAEEHLSLVAKKALTAHAAKYPRKP